MKAIVRQIDGCSFIGKADSNHWVPVDNRKDHAGSDAATHPMELVLLALGGCTGCDVVTILQKKKVALDGLEIHITAERAEDYPKVFTKIHLEFIFAGKDLNQQHLARAVELSQQKYCPVSAMLRPSVPITTSLRIVEKIQGAPQ